MGTSVVDMRMQVVVFPLYIAAYHGFVEVVRMVARVGATLDRQTRNFLYFSSPPCCRRGSL